MMFHVKSIVVACALAIVPSAAFAQAAVQSDTPVPHRSGLSGASELPRAEDSSRDSGVPNAITGPGAPSTTGTGAAGTGPTGTMAAPGR